MATRGVVRFAKREEGVSFNEHPEKIHTQIYHHYDSYPDHLGVGIAKYLSDIRVVNGLGSHKGAVLANGTGCLAAQVLTHLKLGRHYELEKTNVNRNSNEIQQGNIYLDWPDTDRGDIEYCYYVWSDYDKGVWMSIFEGFGSAKDFKCTFVGKPEKLLEKYDKKRD
jgi:hypothetical protein